MPKISIIVPVYNVEQYLAECLDSCVNQTLEDIEIICVDDASPDNSIKILEEYQQKDSRIKIIRHEKNRNLGGARNTGLKNATGEYIWFVDSDDYIDTKACQILYDAIKAVDVDLLMFSALKFFDEKESRIFIYHPYFYQGIQINKVYHPKTSWKEIRFSFLNVVAWSYLTKRSILQNFRFREGVWHEDNDFTPILFSSVNSFCYIPYTAYFYRQTPNSITNSKMSPKRLEDMISLLESFDNFVSDNKINKNHFLYKQLIVEIDYFQRIISSHSEIKANNFNILSFLEKKHHRSLVKFKKSMIPKKRKPKYSIIRFIGKVWKKFFKTKSK